MTEIDFAYVSYEHGGLTGGYPDTLLDQVAALAPEQVNAAASAHLDPAGLIVLAAGDPGTLADLLSPVPLCVTRPGEQR